jgi:hypothetical protein
MIGAGILLKQQQKSMVTSANGAHIYGYQYEEAIF